MGKSKPIMKIDPRTNKIEGVYSSIAEAGRLNFISPQAISMCLNGKKERAAGYRWKYKNDVKIRIIV